MGQTIVVADAFTDRPFGGNPAAVCVTEGPRDETWMQLVAREMNLSETAFLHPDPGGDGYRLRWFTPSIEVDLCGHATLASAHVLWTEGHLPAGETARFHTNSGLLTARQEPEGGWVTLDFPATPVGCAGPVAGAGGVDPSDLAAAVGGGATGAAAVRFAGCSAFDGLVELGSEAAVRAFVPDLAAIGALPVRGVIVTAKAEAPGYDFVSRFFAPRVGVAEDPVCGSAHCVLGPYWGERLGKTDLTAYQASPRGGVLRIGLRGDRVALSGRAVTVLRGRLVGDAG